MGRCRTSGTAQPGPLPPASRARRHAADAPQVMADKQNRKLLAYVAAMVVVALLFLLWLRK